MGRFLLARLAWAVPIIVVILIVNFLIIHLAPGDPVQALVGDFPAPAGYIEQIRHDFGLDQPLWVQLLRYGENLARGHLGYSFANRQPVLGLILVRAGMTMVLMIPGLVAASLLGVVLALAAAPRAGTLFDSGITALSLFGYSVPIFWLGLMALLLFYADLGWAAGPGRLDPWLEDVVPMRSGLLLVDGMLAGNVRVVASALAHLALPAAVLGYYALAYISRMTRSLMLEQLGQDYIAVARAKGLSEGRVLWRHALGNVLVPLATVVTLAYAQLLEGSVLTETVFAWPGIGRYITGSLLSLDMNAVMGGTLVIGAVFIVLNLLVEGVYRRLDPRAR